MKAQRNEVNACDDPDTEARASGKGLSYSLLVRPAGVCQRVFLARWKSIFHFQRLASVCTDDVASAVENMTQKLWRCSVRR